MNLYVSTVGRIAVSLIVVSGFVLVTYIYISGKIAGQNASELVTILVGALATNFTSVVSYWIGSSAGSSDKDAQIKALNQGTP